MSIDQILEQAEAELRSEEQKLKEAVKEKAVELRVIQGQLDSVVAAISRLTGKGMGKPKGSKGKRKSGKPAPTRSDVISVVEGLLTKRGVCHAEVLEQAVTEAVVEQGKSKMGLSLRFKEALQDERFVKGPDGYKLVEGKV